MILKDGLKLNLGCGTLPLNGYVNVDAYEETAPVLENVMEWTTDRWHDVDEIRLEHMLEHLSIQDAPHLLWLCAQYLRPGGKLIVEVPDMEELLANPGPNWLTDIYGVQSHEGEYHRSGYTKTTLLDLIYQVGLKPENVQTFRSTNPVRPGFPCLLVEAVKP